MPSLRVPHVKSVLGALSLLVLGACGGPQTQDDTAEVGTPAPSFVLADFSQRPVTLDALTEEGPTVVIFYRGHW